MLHVSNSILATQKLTYLTWLGYGMNRPGPRSGIANPLEEENSTLAKVHVDSD